MAVVQQAVQDRGGDDAVAQQFAPLPEALVGSEDDDARERGRLPLLVMSSTATSGLWVRTPTTSAPVGEKAGPGT